MNQQPYVKGIIAAIGLLALYIVVMTLLSGWEAAVEQFQALWWLMVPLAVGFGIQVGLYTKIRVLHSRYHVTVHDSNNHRRILAAGGTSSTISMLACCAHHATDVLPFLGISGLSIFLSTYQVPLLAISLVINVIGIFVMLQHLHKTTL